MTSKNSLQKSSREVYEYLITIPLFTGKFDTKNGDRHFMYGIESVMEIIAYTAGVQTGKEFEQMFFNNIEGRNKNE